MKIDRTFFTQQNPVNINKDNNKPEEPQDRVSLGSLLDVEKPPTIIAHRGASKLAPENTISSFKEAFLHGAKMVELDVQQTKDGKLVIMHDDSVDRTTNGKGKISDLTLEEIKSLDAGSKFSPKYAGEKVPTLEEVFEWAKGKVRVDVEIKDTKQLDGMMGELTKVIHNKGMEKDVIITSFDKEAIDSINNSAPELETGILFKANPLVNALKAGVIGGAVLGLGGGIIGGLGLLISAGLTVAGAGLGFLISKEIGQKLGLKGALEEKSEILLPFWALVDKKWVEEAHKKGKIVYPYTVNSPNIVNKLMGKIKVDGVITDTPEKFIK
jgi:glycerophosphoryl diester phosphodiesterase